MAESVCSSCGAPIIWTTTRGGKSMPVDLAPVADGNIELSGLSASKPCAIVYASTPLVAGGPLHKSHFATCPHADQHRRPA